MIIKGHKSLFLYQFTFDRTIKHPVADENSILVASKCLDLKKNNQEIVITIYFIVLYAMV